MLTFWHPEEKNLNVMSFQRDQKRHKSGICDRSIKQFLKGFLKNGNKILIRPLGLLLRQLQNHVK